MNTILSNLKRRSRSRTKHEFASPSKAKPLDILPGVSEEDEERHSISSIRSASPFQSPAHCARRSFGGSATVGGRRSQDAADRKRDSRRVVLTGVEGFSFDDFFPLYNEPPRPAPSPPCTRPTTSPSAPPRPLSDFSSKSIVCDGPIDELDLKITKPWVALDFPSSPSSSQTYRSHSPTPSCSSSRTTSTVSSSSSSSSYRNGPITPLTSDDESQTLHPHKHHTTSPKSRRASIRFMKFMPDFQSQSSAPPACEEEEDDMSDVEDACWIAEIIGDAFTLTTPTPPTPVTPTSNTDLRARPDSIPPPPRMRTAGRSRFSKPLPVVPRLSVAPQTSHGPSVQLDPTFPTVQSRHPAIPSRPPPPPPILIDCPSPTMEEKTDELLRLLANAAMDGGFLGTGLSGSLSPLPPSVPVTPSSTYIPDTPAHARPPPRMSLPADIDDDLDDSSVPGDDEPSTAGSGSLEFELDSLHGTHWPASPESLSLYSQLSASLSADALPSSPFDLRFETSDVLDTPIPDSPLAGGVGMYGSTAPERVLRSRWSSSTLSSMVDAAQGPHSASSWMLRFNLGSSSPSKKDGTKPHRPSFSRPSLRFGLKSPGSPNSKRAAGALERRESCNSRMSDCGSDSGDSTTSSGLRRKPIPIEIFMRS